MSRWWAPKPHGEHYGLAFIRIVVAILLVLHPLHAFAHPSDAHGATWIALVAVLIASGMLIVPRFARLGAAIAMVVVAGGAIFLYAPNWFVVGGRAVEGHPGIEYNMLLLGCLAAIATGRDHLGMQIVRVVTAASLVPHGIAAYFDIAGMHQWGDAMTANGWPHGVLMVWSIKIGELVGAIARISGRFVVFACLGHLAYLIPGMWISHEWDWFVVGPGEGGIEFSVLLIAGALATLFVYLPTRDTARPR
ncbi:MAG: DoxX family protein [Kofleriaceae bacterium]